MAMVEAPFGFLEMIIEVFPAHSPQLCQAQLGKAPKRFNPVDVTPSPGKLILVMMDAIVLVAFEHQTVVGAPSVGVDRAPRRDDLSLDDAHQFSLGAVHDRGAEDLSSSFEQSDHRHLSSSSTASKPSNAPRSKVAFIHFHAASKGCRFRLGQLHNPGSQKPVDTMRRILIHPAKLAGRQRSNIRAPKPQNLSKLSLRNPRMRQISVSHCLPIDYTAPSRLI